MQRPLIIEVMCDGKCIDCSLPVHCDDPAWRDGENLKIRKVGEKCKAGTENKKRG